MTAPSNDDLNKIVWSIKNKYYSASVHFHVVQVDELHKLDVNGFPALIFTWDSNEPYDANSDILASVIISMDPEVSLAIGPNVSDDTENLDDYFADRGLEYVEIHPENAVFQSNGISNSETSPGLRRAIDALSTIMWPSMVRPQSSTGKLPAASNMDETDLDMLSLMASNNKSSLQREMEELEKWLEEDLDLEASNDQERDPNDPWSFTSSSFSKPVEQKESSPSVALGFEDDFSDFVSAPPAEMPQKPDDDVENELPSQSEVRKASEHIFRDAAPAEAGGLFSQGEDEEGSASPTFDLSRVLSALQGMKEEIAAIPDERERRKAAAKVALGLVYGLEGTSEELDFGV